MNRTMNTSKLALLALLATGCALEPRVPRVYGGRVTEGPFVPSEAYSAYLRGVLAEEAGDLKSALAAYEETIKEDDEDPEPFTRIGDLRCRLDPKNHGADEAFKRAASLDRTYAPLLAARARCASARGHTDQALALTESVARADRESPQLEALYLSLAATRPERTRAVALTVAAGEHVVAWEALVAWGRSHDEPELVARGLEGLLRVAPNRSGEIEAGALSLLGAGELALARRVAAAVADAPADLGVRGVQDATAARLAVDEALVRGDMPRAERRAVRGHVSRAEVAGRAMLLGRAEEAVALGTEILRADPKNSGAAMVASASSSASVSWLARNTGPMSKSGEPAACALALAQRLVAIGQVEAARQFLAGVTPERLAPNDPLGVVLVDLVARDAAPESALSPALRLEVAARRREAPKLEPDALATFDARHRLLFHSLVDPTGAPARGLLAKLGLAADRDPLVGLALVRAALASPPGADDGWSRIRAAVAGAAGDPLVLAAAVELAQKSGKPDELAPARARLMAVARTPAERALARP